MAFLINCILHLTKTDRVILKQRNVEHPSCTCVCACNGCVSAVTWCPAAITTLCEEKGKASLLRSVSKTSCNTSRLQKRENKKKTKKKKPTNKKKKKLWQSFNTFSVFVQPECRNNYCWHFLCIYFYILVYVLPAQIMLEQSKNVPALLPQSYTHTQNQYYIKKMSQQ